jgi:hypothetical protein
MPINTNVSLKEYMSNPGILFKRYSWLINLIGEYPGYYSREDILKLYGHQINLGKNDNPVPAKTFHNHVEAIKEIFGIEIVCSKSTGKYRLKEDIDSEKNAVRDWMLDTISVSNSLDDCKWLHDRILFEAIPSGQQFLQTLIKAMKENHVVWLTYKKFGDEEPTHRYLEPWALKVFKQRWYLLGEFHYPDAEKPGFYCLDRVEKVDLAEETFSLPKKFNADDYLRDYFGVTLSWDKPQIIRIEVEASQVIYFRTLPLHKTQKEVEIKDDYSIFEYELIPSFEFEQEIFSHMDYVKVLEPESLKKDIAKIVTSLNKMYSKNK